MSEINTTEVQKTTAPAGQSETTCYAFSTEFQSRTWCCHRMVSLLPSWTRTVLEPTPGLGNLVAALKDRGFTVTAPDNFFDIDGSFDAVVMNPPFTPMKQGYEILYRAMDMTDHIIALMPWLSIINSERRSRDIMKWGLRSITHLPRNTFKGARVQTCILDMQRGYRAETTFLVA